MNHVPGLSNYSTPSYGYERLSDLSLALAADYCGPQFERRIWIVELRFEYVVKEVRQLIIFEGEVDTCHKEGESRPENRPFQGAVFATIDISSEAPTITLEARTPMA